MAAQPFIERSAGGDTVSLGRFVLGLPDWSADAALFEFGGTRPDLALDGASPHRYPHRGSNKPHDPGLVSGRDPFIVFIDERASVALLRSLQLRDKGLDILNINAKAALLQDPRDVEDERVSTRSEPERHEVKRLALVHGRLPRRIGVGGLTGFPAAAMMAPTFSVAARNGSRNRCAYLAVVVGFEWPSSAPISGRLAPPETSWLA